MRGKLYAKTTFKLLRPGKLCEDDIYFEFPIHRLRPRSIADKNQPRWPNLRLRRKARQHARALRRKKCRAPIEGDREVVTQPGVFLRLFIFGISFFGVKMAHRQGDEKRFRKSRALLPDLAGNAQCTCGTPVPPFMHARAKTSQARLYVNGVLLLALGSNLQKSPQLWGEANVGPQEPTPL